MKHFSDSEKEQIYQMVYDYLINHGALGGEMIGQDNETQIDAIELASELADIKDVIKETEIYNFKLI